MDPKLLAQEQASAIIYDLESEFHHQMPQSVQAARQKLSNTTEYIENLKIMVADTQAEVAKLQDLVNNYYERYAKAQQEHQKKVDEIKRLEYAVFIPNSSKRSRREMSNWCRKQTKSKKYVNWAVTDVVGGFFTEDFSKGYGCRKWHDSMLGQNPSGTVYFFADKQTAMLFKLTFI